ncbi:MAG: glycosyltransferase family 4 protein [Fimbriimonas ginsengisoli]|uniref:Glycosyltransferase family 4 protein n=1 Tax=Fimbriimonas ginsengisoli TaxID=1005039 RepID=A0A931PW87_FIMGI|nr:glycosyltransferase family 4 protein [Fimbriimonas ginsengisoli]
MRNFRLSKKIKRVALVGSYVPRQCGIASFTADLRTALADEDRELDLPVVALNDRDAGYDYPPEVRFQIAQHDIESYRLAADFINTCAPDIVCVQHEFGLYGGPGGDHLVAFLNDLRMPAVTVLHTVLKNPSREQQAALDRIIQLSSRLVVMSRKAADILVESGAVDESHIELTHHGVPSFVTNGAAHDEGQLDALRKRILLSVGLLSPDKGIENVLHAMPRILAQVPDTVYLVVGATHPHVLEREGEAYRESLGALAVKLGIEDSVIFHNRFVDSEELGRTLALADICLTPYLKEEQVTSGVLAYAVGAGKAVISTPFWHAQEVLGEGRGVLVPFADPAAIASAAVELLADDYHRHAIQGRALALGREMAWPSVALRYMALFEDVIADHEGWLRLAASSVSSQLVQEGDEARLAPPLNLAHLRRMTDDVGLIQHATYVVPNYSEGYCLDDNARALLLTTQLCQSGRACPDEVAELATRYLAFVQYAFNGKNGRFRNFLGFDRKWLEDQGSDDSHGRALWALGATAARHPDFGIRALSAELFQAGLSAARTFKAPRSRAFVVLGLTEYLRAHPDDESASSALRRLAGAMHASLKQARSADWVWFQDELTYGNARLPQALLLAGQTLRRPELEADGLEVLEWLVGVQQSPEGWFEPVGNAAPYRRGGEKPRYDLQPIEATDTVSAYLGAWRLTGDPIWSRRARHAFDWLLGNNPLGLPLYDSVSGGCRDGLQENGLNENQGAESTVLYHLAWAEMAEAGLVGQQRETGVALAL